MFKLVKVLIVSVNLTLGWVSAPQALEWVYLDLIGYNTDGSSFAISETTYSEFGGGSVRLRAFNSNDGKLGR